jgi:hypothetical protein
VIVPMTCNMLTITHCERFKDKFNIAPMLESLGARPWAGSSKIHFLIN